MCHARRLIYSWSEHRDECSFSLSLSSLKVRAAHVTTHSVRRLDVSAAWTSRRLCVADVDAENSGQLRSAGALWGGHEGNAAKSLLTGDEKMQIRSGREVDPGFELLRFESVLKGSEKQHLGKFLIFSANCVCDDEFMILVFLFCQDNMFPNRHKDLQTCFSRL